MRTVWGCERTYGPASSDLLSSSVIVVMVSTCCYGCSVVPPEALVVGDGAASSIFSVSFSAEDGALEGSFFKALAGLPGVSLAASPAFMNLGS